LQHRLADVEPVTLLYRDAADSLATGVVNNADVERLALAVELTGDPPLPQQLRRGGRIVGEELGEDWLRRRRRRCRRRSERNEQQ
jgi:hypothetical protein